MTVTILDPGKLRELWPSPPPRKELPWTIREVLLQEELVRLLALIHAGYTGGTHPVGQTEMRVREVRKELVECAAEKLIESL